MAVAVSVILERKGAEVVTVTPDVPLLSATRVMADNGIGALVVSADQRSVEGIVSERDLVRWLARYGTDCLQRPVSEVMTAEVWACSLETTVDELMATMTERRIRHMPVVVDGGLAGIVSIGDVVKSRLDELEFQAEVLEQYVTGSH